MFTLKLGTSLQRSATRFAVYSTNRELTELSSQILRMVSARSSATPIWRIFAHASASGFNGMVSVTTSSSITEASMRLTAGPDNTGCVQYATTRTAPCSFNARARRAAVLARIPEVRDRGGDARGARAAQRIDHDHQLHQRVIGRRARRLQHEHILAADVLEELHHHLAVAEARHRGLAELDAQVLRHPLREPRVGVAREHHQVVEGHRLGLSFRPLL